MGYKSATAALGETCTHWRICILNGRGWIHGKFFLQISEWFVKIKATHFFLTSVVCVYPPRYPKTLVFRKDSEAFWCWQKITSHQLHQAGRKHGRSIGRWYRKVPHIFPITSRFSQGAQLKKKSASACCVKSEEFFQLCFGQVGLNQTCGVNGCYCGVLSDLLCDEPPLPKQICVKVGETKGREATLRTPNTCWSIYIYIQAVSFSA